MSSFDDAFTKNYLDTMYPTRSEDSEEFPMRAGAMDAEMKAIPQTGLQKIAEGLGIKLEEIGQALENMPPIQIKRTGQTLNMKDLFLGIGARDLFPVLGSSVERPIEDTRTLTGKEVQVDGEQLSGETKSVETGIPQVLQQLGKGMSLTTGKGATTELRPEVKQAIFDAMDVAGTISGAGKVVTGLGKAAIKRAAKKTKPDTEGAQ